MCVYAVHFILLFPVAVHRPCIATAYVHLLVVPTLCVCMYVCVYVYVCVCVCVYMCVSVCVCVCIQPAASLQVIMGCNVRRMHFIIATLPRTHTLLRDVYADVYIYSSALGIGLSIALKC